MRSISTNIRGGGASSSNNVVKVVMENQNEEILNRQQEPTTAMDKLQISSSYNDADVSLQDEQHAVPQVSVNIHKIMHDH